MSLNAWKGITVVCVAEIPLRLNQRTDRMPPLPPRPPHKVNSGYEPHWQGSGPGWGPLDTLMALVLVPALLALICLIVIGIAWIAS